MQNCFWRWVCVCVCMCRLLWNLLDSLAAYVAVTTESILPWITWALYSLKLQARCEDLYLIGSCFAIDSIALALPFCISVWMYMSNITFILFFLYAHEGSNEMNSIHPFALSFLLFFMLLSLSLSFFLSLSLSLYFHSVSGSCIANSTNITIATQVLKYSEWIK